MGTGSFQALAGRGEDLPAGRQVTGEIVANIRSWQHSGFSVDQSVGLEAEDSEGIRKLIEYFLRCPFKKGVRDWVRDDF
jgi:hypothetical protein